MTIKEIYQNLVENEKVETPQESLDVFSKFEARLAALEQGEGYLKLSADFFEVFRLNSEDCFTLGFKAAVQLMSECMDKKL